jgi:uncharacterized protein (TIGR03790 family)
VTTTTRPKKFPERLIRFLPIWFAFIISSNMQAQSALGQRVLVVYADGDSASGKFAEYYMHRRNIPRENLCRIKTRSSTDDGSVSIAWQDFDSLIKRPIQKCLQAVGKDKILYIVFSYRTPYRLSAAPKGAGVAIDQHLADIWGDAGGAERVANPYYAPIQSKLGIYPAFRSLADYRASRGSEMIYSVWRLDSATPSLARGLVDKAITAEQEGVAGQVCIDRRYGKDIQNLPDTGYASGDWDLYRAAQLFRGAGLHVTEDTEPAEFGTPPAPARCDGAIFYAGWYSLNHYNDVFTWNPGAIGLHLDSASASDPRGGKNWSANAIKRGITVTAGALDEPLLRGLPHPDGIVHDLLAGANVGDAFLRNTAYLRWMIINIGDPLYRPKFLVSHRK